MAKECMSKFNGKHCQAELDILQTWSYGGGVADVKFGKSLDICSEKNNGEEFQISQWVFMTNKYNYILQLFNVLKFAYPINC